MPMLSRLRRIAFNNLDMSTGFVESVSTQILSEDVTDPQIIQSVQEDTNYQNLVNSTSESISNIIQSFVDELENIKSGKSQF